MENQNRIHLSLAGIIILHNLPATGLLSNSAANSAFSVKSKLLKFLTCQGGLGSLRAFVLPRSPAVFVASVLACARVVCAQYCTDTL